MTRPGDTWSVPPMQMHISHEDVHVWRAFVSSQGMNTARLYDILTAEEREKAGRFHFAQHRHTFIATRGVLRLILARYTGIEAPAIRFGYGPHGKPFLANDEGAAGLSFNMSHSHGLALYAIACKRRVGIDVEYISGDLAAERIAEHFFSPAEVAALRSLPAEVQNQAFFNCWTRKEAMVKAIGDGLSFPLDAFDVTLAPGEPAALLAIRTPNQDIGRWMLHALYPADGYVAALAVEGYGWRLQCWQWDDM